ncbi:efflux transporter outer membrane subunit [Methylomicrobium lacus]|uniref:efflux transporter outer membrane subunit n=1 Tax=Methylomicrobium lacus TaxID=136992 RepID=UPI00045E98C8|nr:efflux transporter outer membrane subunit [Methylomicrobium lacus]
MPHDLKQALAGLFCLLLAGCMTTPERERKTALPPLPGQWSAERQKQDPMQDHWLETFADPLLTQTVRTAIADNYDLRATAARIDAARARMRIDGAGRWPQLALLAGYRRGDPGTSAPEIGAFTALFDLSWELDVWGRIRAAQLASGQDVEAAKADWQAARLSLAARTAQNYIELAEARAQVMVAEQSMRERRTLVDLLRGRFRRGLTPALDLRLALTDLANAEAQLAEQRTREQNLTRDLEVLLGRYPDGRFAKAEALPPLPPAVPAGIPSELLERRPDLNAAFDRLCAADKRLESARKALLPRFTLTGSGGAGSAALTELVDPRAAAWNLALGLLQPIFTGGRLRGEIKLQEASVEEALNGYRNAALNAFREVEQTLAAEDRLREQESALREAVKQTDASRKLAVYSYQHGLIEILTLLDSYRSTLNAQSAHLTARRQLLNNRIDLYLALGGGF